MKSRKIIPRTESRGELLMPITHREVTGDELVSLGDWIYLKKEGKWFKTMTAQGFARRTVKVLNEKHGLKSHPSGFRFSTPTNK